MHKKKYRIKSEYDFYRMISTEKGLKPVLVIYHVQVKSRIIGWMTIKTFMDEDFLYAYTCAKELLDILNESI